MEGKLIEVTYSPQLPIPQESKLGSPTRTPNTKESSSSSNSLWKCFQLKKEYKYIEAKTEPVRRSHQKGNRQRFDPGSSMKPRIRPWRAKLAESPVELTLENTCTVNLDHCRFWVDWGVKDWHCRPFGK
jgi:hypothetical protein